MGTKITRVVYTALVNLGNYENERVELEALPEEGQDYLDVLNELKLKVHEQLNRREEYLETEKRYREAKKELAVITEKLTEAKKTWEIASTFLIAQGINFDPAKFPDIFAVPEDYSEPFFNDADEDDRSKESEF